ncbi:hypothetical protein ACFLT4_04285, partial [Chloroflexota bacterium]
PRSFTGMTCEASQPRYQKSLLPSGWFSPFQLMLKNSYWHNVSSVLLFILLTYGKIALCLIPYSFIF